MNIKMTPEQQLAILKMMIVDFVLSVRGGRQAGAQKAFNYLGGVTDAIIKDVHLEMAAEETGEVLAKMKEGAFK